jgi:hypothetical protein
MNNIVEQFNNNETKRKFDFSEIVYQRIASYFNNQFLIQQPIEHRTLRKYVCRVFRIQKKDCQLLFLEMDSRGLLHLNNRGIVILKKQEVLA